MEKEAERAYLCLHVGEGGTGCQPLEHPKVCSLSPRFCWTSRGRAEGDNEGYWDLGSGRTGLTGPGTAACSTVSELALRNKI